MTELPGVAHGKWRLPTALKLAAAIGGLSGGCFGGGWGGGEWKWPTVPRDPPVVSSLEVQAPGYLVAGDTMTAWARYRDQYSSTMYTTPVPGLTWSSSAPSVAKVGLDGLVTGVSAGQTVITGTSGGFSGQDTTVVFTEHVASLTLLPETAGLRVGAVLILTATPRDASGKVLIGRPIAWRCGSDCSPFVELTGPFTSVASAKGRSVGTALISVDSDGQWGTATVTVTK